MRIPAKSLGLWVLALLLTVAVAGNAMAAKQISIGTAGATGTYYPIGAAFAKVINDFVPGVYAVAEVTGGSVENMKLVSTGDAEIGFANQMHFRLAQKGSPPFDKPITNLRALFPLAGKDYEMKHAWQLVVPANSPIKSLSDLKGKRVGVGPAGSGTEVYTKQVLETFGTTYKDIVPRFLSYSEEVSAIQDGTIDAVAFHSAFPTGAVVELGSTRNVRLVPIEEAMVKRLSDDWGFMRQVIPAGTYEWQKEDVVTVVANYHVLFVNKDMDPNLAYQLTKAAMEHKDKIWPSNPAAKGYDETGVVMGLTAPPLHVGALKYYREIGIKVPDSVIPPEAK